MWQLIGLLFSALAWRRNWLWSRNLHPPRSIGHVPLSFQILHMRVPFRRRRCHNKSIQQYASSKRADRARRLHSSCRQSGLVWYCAESRCIVWKVKAGEVGIRVEGWECQLDQGWHVDCGVRDWEKVGEPLWERELDSGKCHQQHDLLYALPRRPQCGYERDNHEFGPIS